MGDVIKWKLGYSLSRRVLVMDYEPSYIAKERLMLEIAIKHEYGLELCEMHYYQHLKGSFECFKRCLEQLHELFNEAETRS